MTSEVLVQRTLRSIDPRPGFQTELLAALSPGAPRPFLMDDVAASRAWLARRLVVGVVAGMVSAGGAAYLGIRRHNRKKGGA